MIENLNNFLVRYRAKLKLTRKQSMNPFRKLQKIRISISIGSILFNLVQFQSIYFSDNVIAKQNKNKAMFKFD